MAVVHIKENIGGFRRGKRNCPVYAGVLREGFHCTIITGNGNIIITITMIIVVVIVIIVVIIVDVI